jgi:hypothetical protein
MPEVALGGGVSIGEGDTFCPSGKRVRIGVGIRNKKNGKFR